MARRKTMQEFKDEINKLTNGEYILLSEYKNSVTKVKVKHGLCGEIYLVKPNNFLNGNRCSRCQRIKKTKTNEKFKKQVYEVVANEYTFLEKYSGASKKIEVVHNDCGYKWGIAPNKFLLGTRCPKCIIKKRRKKDSEFKREIYDIVGDEYKILNEYINCKIKVKIKHEKCGYIWDVAPLAFRNGTRCPKCSPHALKTTKKFTEEVREKTKDKYLILGEYKNYDTKILVKHKECGTEFFTFPGSILSGSACRKCSNEEKRKGLDKYKIDVFNLVGDEYIVCGEYKNNKAKTNMKHMKCGNIWPIAPSNFLRGKRCPRCKRSKGEIAIEELLIKHDVKYITQHGFKDCRDKAMLKFDFAILNKDDSIAFLVEYDGIQHYKIIDGFNGKEGFKSRKARDNIKNKYCRQNGISLVRIPYWKYNEIDKILLRKLSKLNII